MDSPALKGASLHKTRDISPVVAGSLEPIVTISRPIRIKIFFQQRKETKNGNHQNTN